ncbi:MAG: SH3 domain-containing protein [Lachnospiraceae bacterium]|nr:SH3 domain-containing protein [Lachnospiraceae bacterium]MDE6184506.1 SH3 domain-containing protein [Lachnospiraceae bacterium]
MKHSDQNKMHMLKEKFMIARDWVMDHNKIVMPLVLVVCVLLTIVVAVNANHREALENEAKEAAMAVSDKETGSQVEGLGVPVFELEENAHPEINNLIRTYYDAQASGDIGTISSMNAYLNEIETIRVEELSKYIESYPVLDVYTKPGLTENTYVAYVYSEVQFADVDDPLPGMQTYYIGMGEEGNYFINDGTYDDAVWNYIKEVTLQDDVVDLNNKVVVEYNELLAEDAELNEFIAYLKEKINEEVGEVLAQAEVPETTDTPEAGDTPEEIPETETGEGTQDTPSVITMVRTTDIVNIRTSDSEEADKIDKAQIGQEFTLLEQRGNGWSKVDYNGREAFIKSDYLEEVSAEEADIQLADAEQPVNEPEETVTSNNETSMGTVTVIESVKVRKSASTSAESLGTAYTGDELELIMKQADGWSRVRYNGQTAYVKSDYVE